MNIYGKIAESKPAPLVSGDGDKISIIVAPGNGVVARGTVMYRQDNGIYAPATAADAVATKYLVVLENEVDTDEMEGIAQDAAAYRTGHFLRGRVTLAAGAELTNDAIVALRTQGLHIDPLDDWSEEDKVIDNSVTG